MEIKFKENIFKKETGEGIVVLGPNEKSVFLINNTGKRILELIDKDKGTEEITLILKDEYGLSEDTIKKDISCFLEEVKKNSEIFEFKGIR